MDISVYRSELNSFFNSYGGWEWFCSMNLRRGTQCVDAEKLIKVWAREVAKEEHMQVCYQGVYTAVPHHHVHLLMSGLDKHGHTLADKDPSRSESKWGSMVREAAKILNVYDEGVVDYVTDHNTPVDKFELITPYNVKLLNKKKRFKDDPSLVPPKSIWHPSENDNILMQFIRECQQQGRS